MKNAYLILLQTWSSQRVRFFYCYKNWVPLTPSCDVGWGLSYFVFRKFSWINVLLAIHWKLNPSTLASLEISSSIDFLWINPVNVFCFLSAESDSSREKSSEILIPFTFLIWTLNDEVEPPMHFKVLLQFLHSAVSFVWRKKCCHMLDLFDIVIKGWNSELMKWKLN